MNISIRPVTKENFEQISDLAVSEAQQDYVAENSWSLLESKYHTGYTTRGIYLDEKPVGFFMWVAETPSKISIWRFMMDEQYQKQGIGRVAMELALHDIKLTAELQEIEICYNPSNPVAESFYQSFGFTEVGMDEDDEDILAIISL
ncbi:diamine N-acetyltransferase [Paraglaciecola mesophila KMM 241]|uniref:Diamine N-acetyltransferase n=1 Tax=Paraglaciecola mesophila KMM 241 TaxID=1128912 RepID=K6YET8_9ALTE|nr:GNAT family N-acetyltransferase [Paraglaciecola mesophila]GAC22481.1 diamine N-acetyltransferase [Paraglaciecola mesophila KMM 241]|tara:strand:+ start:62 stop:499 length:438 start_codon:yes stop_codon:yes gene_type:complete